MSIPLLVFVQFLEPGLRRCTCRNEQNPLALIKLKVLLLGHKVDLDLSACLLNISVLHCGISHCDRIAGIQFVYVRSMKLFGRGRRDICKVCYQNPYPSRLECSRNFSTESFRVGGQTTSAICGSLVRRAVECKAVNEGPWPEPITSNTALIAAVFETAFIIPPVLAAFASFAALIQVTAVYYTIHKIFILTTIPVDLDCT